MSKKGGFGSLAGLTLIAYIFLRIIGVIIDWLENNWKKAVKRAKKEIKK